MGEVKKIRPRHKQGTPEIITPTVVLGAPVNKAKLVLEDKMLRMYCRFDQKEICKSVGGCAWNKDKKTWDYSIRPEVVKKLMLAFGTMLEVEHDVLALLDTTLPVHTVNSMGRLFPFQKDGVAFIAQNKRVLLADDMGLGKTVQAIIAARSLGKKIIVVCPASLKRNWAREFTMWAPEVKSVVIDGSRAVREAQIQTLDTDVIIVNYETIRLVDQDQNGCDVFYHIEALKKLKFDVIILDEAHKIKNRKTSTTNACRVLAKHIPYVIELTGTPVMNKPEDLWTLLNVLDPRKFSSYWKFVERYCIIEFNGFSRVAGGLNPLRKLELRDILGNYMLRRTKMEVLLDMPDKLIQKIFVPLEGKQLKIYTDMAKAMYTKLETGEVVSASVVIAQITRLKQIVIDPNLIGGSCETFELNGAKITALLDILENLDGGKVVIFSQFAQVVRRLLTRLQRLGYKGGYLAGDMDSKGRDDVVQKFQNDPDFQILVVSTLAGGVGLTLTAASTAIFLDKYWTPAINNQAQDRIHRIGQKNACTIVEILAEATIEEAIEELLASKYEQFKALFSTDDFATSDVRISKADFRSILGYGIK